MSIGDQIGSILESTGQNREQKGLTLAKVTNVNDPDKLNRVKCLAIGQGKDEETDWCYVMAPLGGKECGQFFFPNVDDQVVLAFLDDNPHRPIVLGAYWSTELKPPYVIEDGKVHNFTIKTPNQTELLFYDEPQKQRVTLTMPSGTLVAIDDEKQSVSIQDEKGENALTLDLKGGEVTLKAKTKLTISAGGTSIVLESSGNITQKGSKTVSVEGTTVEVKGSNKLALSGTTAELTASATLDLKGSAQANLKGGMVNIN